MKEKYIHIVDFDVPYPPNYGSAVDMYCRLKAIYHLGGKIILHCFQNGRKKSTRLNDFCQQVHYYPRKSILQFPFTSEPYMVYSRRNTKLFDRLFADDFPVLLEGVHTCSVLMDKRYKKKPFYVRMHNVEHEHYEYLSETAKDPLSKYYYKKESKRLKKFEKNLDRVQCLFSISERDHATLSTQFPRVEYVPPFVNNDEVDCKTGRGMYALYHGNLTVEENLKAAKFLIRDVFPGLNISLIVAGTKASDLSGFAQSANIEFIDSPTASDLKDLVRNAHVNVLPTFHPAGIKYKLINSLFAGRYCVVNPPMIDGNGLGQLCHVAKDAVEMKKIIQELFKKDFSQEEINRRKEILEDIYSNHKNAQKIGAVIFGA